MFKSINQPKFNNLLIKHMQKINKSTIMSNHKPKQTKKPMKRKTKQKRKDHESK